MGTLMPRNEWNMQMRGSEIVSDATGFNQRRIELLTARPGKVCVLPT